MDELSEMKAPVFDVSGWCLTLIDAVDDYRTLCQLSRDAPVVDAHLGSRKLIVADSQGIRRVSVSDAEGGAIWRESHRASIELAVERYSRQMVVLARTYLETLLKEFLLVRFVGEPMLMHDYLADDNGNGAGMVRLAELVRSTSKESLLELLASRATSKAVKGKFKAVATRLKKLTGHDIPNDLVSRISDWTELRNRIVHNGDRIDVGDERVEEIFADVQEFVLFLGRTAHALALAYEDGGNFLGLRISPEGLGDDFVEVGFDGELA